MRKKIGEMRNLGPAVEADLNNAGIYYADEVVHLGAEKAFLKMLEGRQKQDRSAACCNALYLYSFYGAIHDLDWRDIPEEVKIKFKTFTQKLRNSGRFQK